MLIGARTRQLGQRLCTHPVLLLCTVMRMDGVELELECPCGSENFTRVVVQRKPHPPIVTDFVACVNCKAMYWSPLRPPDPPEPTIGSHMRGIGGPEKLRVDSAAACNRATVVARTVTDSRIRRT